MEYIFKHEKLSDIDFSKYAEYRHEDVHVNAYERDVWTKMWINEPRKVIWDNTAADHDAENVIVMTEKETIKLEIEEARALVATMARQMDLSAMCGQIPLFDAEEKPETVKAISPLFSAALKTVLRAAGLSIAWHDAPEGAITPWMDDHIESSNGREAN